jgi:hypothetical protein
MVAAAVGWRQVHRRRVRARIARTLRDPDPTRRGAAVRVATEQGLRTYARLLVARAAVETDPEVRATLVDAVLRTAWEPADLPAILDLRLWAHEERARSQPDTTPSTTILPVVALPTRALPTQFRPRVMAPQATARHRAAGPRTRFPLVAEGHR